MDRGRGEGNMMTTKVQITANSKDPLFGRVCGEAAAQMRRLKIPGAAVGILHNGREYCAGLGVTSLENPLPVTGDTLFQIASISKTYLATAMTRLVEAGKLNLDAPLKKYLPELKLKDKKVAEQVTMRHLLTHTGGWFGDYFNDFGNGDDAMQKMVESMAGLPQVTPLGKIWSYNNSGFYLAGRALERITGKPFEAAMRELVFDPLGLTMTFYSHSEVMTHPFAAGHRKKKGQLGVDRPYGMSRAPLAAGGIISNVRDALRYCRFHAGNGTIDGKRVISKAGLSEMHAPLFPAAGDRKIALAWFSSQAGGHTVISHTGSINGQISDLRIIPELGFAVVVFTGSGSGSEACTATINTALERYLGIRPAKLNPVSKPKGSLGEYIGRYDLPSTTCDIVRGAKGLVLKYTDKGGYPTPSSPPGDQPPPVPLSFYSVDNVMGLESPYKNLRGEFLRGKGGRIEWLRVYSRVHKRINGGAPGNR